MEQIDDLGIEIKPKEEVLWEEVLKGAENELKNTEEIYFKNKKFNEGVVRLAKEELKRIRQLAEGSD